MFAVISNQTQEVWGLGKNAKEALNHAKEVTFSSIHPVNNNPSLLGLVEIKEDGDAFLELESKGDEVLFDCFFSVDNGSLIKHSYQ